MPGINRRLWCAGLTGALVPAIGTLTGTWAPSALAQRVDKREQLDRWYKVRDTAFAGRDIIEDTDGKVVVLHAPDRALDAAVVPVSIESRFDQTPERHVRKMHLVIDNNPSPLGATFTYGPASGRASLETRVRVEEYTHMRALAELNDGKLYMSTRFVKASGGCSAPAGKDPAEALANLGRMRLRVEGAVHPNAPTLAQLMISHPNISGLAIDQLTRLAPAPRFVRSVELTYDGESVMTADVDFTISENPNFRFWFLPRHPGELKAAVVDTSEAAFEQQVAVAFGGAAT